MKTRAIEDKSSIISYIFKIWEIRQ